MKKEKIQIYRNVFIIVDQRSAALSLCNKLLQYNNQYRAMNTKCEVVTNV